MGDMNVRDGGAKLDWPGNELESPDLSQYQIMPELGPRILFFSGGTAIKGLSREMVRYTHNSIHIVTPFDSGGSSAHLRRAFGMLAVGDLRNRLMALVDVSTIQGNPSIQRLFAHRLPQAGTPEELEEKLKQMVIGMDPMMAEIRPPHRDIIQTYLRSFLSRMPRGFDLRGANIGNLVIAGGYLKKGRAITPLISLLAKVAEVKGVVRPVTDMDCHLVTELENGQSLLGQHLIAGKEAPPIGSPIRRISLSKSPYAVEPISVKIKKETEYLIRGADLICFPMGSFYSSVLANLLPDGVGRAVARNKAPKIYIPNTGDDPEQLGMSAYTSVCALVESLQKTAPAKTPVGKLLNHVVVDTRFGEYLRPLELDKIQAMGIGVIDAGLTTRRSVPYFDERLLAAALLSIVGHGKRKKKKAVAVA